MQFKIFSWCQSASCGAPGSDEARELRSCKGSLVGTSSIGSSGFWEAWARRLIGVSYRLRGDLDKAKEYLDRSLEIFIESGEKEEVAKCHLEYGYLYKALGQKEKSRKSFETSSELFKELGMMPWVEKILAELK